MTTFCRTFTATVTHTFGSLWFCGWLVGLLHTHLALRTRSVCCTYTRFCGCHSGSRTCRLLVTVTLWVLARFFMHAFTATLRTRCRFWFMQLVVVPFCCGYRFYAVTGYATHGSLPAALYGLRIRLVGSARTLYRLAVTCRSYTWLRCPFCHTHRLVLPTGSYYTRLPVRYHAAVGFYCACLPAVGPRLPLPFAAVGLHYIPFAPCLCLVLHFAFTTVRFTLPTAVIYPFARTFTTHTTVRCSCNTRCRCGYCAYAVAFAARLRVHYIAVLVACGYTALLHRALLRLPPAVATHTHCVRGSCSSADYWFCYRCLPLRFVLRTTYATRSFTGSHTRTRLYVALVPRTLRLPLYLHARLFYHCHRVLLFGSLPATFTFTAGSLLDSYGCVLRWLVTLLPATACGLLPSGYAHVAHCALHLYRIPFTLLPVWFTLHLPPQFG